MVYKLPLFYDRSAGDMTFRPSDSSLVRNLSLDWVRLLFLSEENESLQGLGSYS